MCRWHILAPSKQRGQIIVSRNVCFYAGCASTCRLPFAVCLSLSPSHGAHAFPSPFVVTAMPINNAKSVRFCSYNVCQEVVSSLHHFCMSRFQSLAQKIMRGAIYNVWIQFWTRADCSFSEWGICSYIYNCLLPTGRLLTFIKPYTLQMPHKTVVFDKVLCHFYHFR